MSVKGILIVFSDCSSYGHTILEYRVQKKLKHIPYVLDEKKKLFRETFKTKYFVLNSVADALRRGIADYSRQNDTVFALSKEVSSFYIIMACAHTLTKQLNDNLLLCYKRSGVSCQSSRV
jgi:hypothetical protein